LARRTANVLGVDGIDWGTRSLISRGEGDVKAPKTVGRAAFERLVGEQPSAPRASMAAVAVGGAVAVVVYRALRG
jgi:hypothetical protein